MNFYWICTLYHWDRGHFDLLLNTLKLNLLDTSPRVCKPRLLGTSVSSKGRRYIFLWKKSCVRGSELLYLILCHAYITEIHNS